MYDIPTLDLTQKQTRAHTRSPTNCSLRYHALRIGPFPDVYEWLTSSHLEKGDFTASLASAERANEIFVGWGRPYGHYARVLAGMDRRWVSMRFVACSYG